MAAAAAAIGSAYGLATFAAKSRRCPVPTAIIALYSSDESLSSGSRPGIAYAMAYRAAYRAWGT